MNKPEFTPGPWVIDSGTNETSHVITDQENYQNPGYSWHCLVVCMDNYDANETAANARLIAAAPGMYELLQRLINKESTTEGEYYFAGEVSKILREADELLNKINNG